MHIWKYGSIYLDAKTACLAKVLKGFGFTNAKLTNTPVVDTQLQTQFQQIIESLMYVGHMPRCGICSEQDGSMLPTHLNHALHICCYLVCTSQMHWCIMVNQIEGWSCVPTLTGHPILWNTGPQLDTWSRWQMASSAGILGHSTHSYMPSSTEAEYMLLSDTSRQLVWIKQSAPK